MGDSSLTEVARCIPDSWWIDLETRGQRYGIVKLYEFQFQDSNPLIDIPLPQPITDTLPDETSRPLT
jgi:hypothetical protein